MSSILKRSFIIVLTVLSFVSNAFGWSCETHSYIALEAGMKNPDTACFPDLSREESMDVLGPSHWHNAAPNTVVTPAYIDTFNMKDRYLKLGSPDRQPITINVPHPSGVLYWKIVELYKKMKGTTGWKYDYYLSNIAHYIGDLSQPLHNFPHAGEPASDGKTYPEIGSWAKDKHGDFDSRFDDFLPLKGEDKENFQKLITSIQITSVNDLKREISTIANNSISLANKGYSHHDKPFEKEDAFRQIAMSVSLLKAIINSTK